MRDSLPYDAAFECRAAPAGALRPLALTVVDAMSTPARATVDLVATAGDVAPESLVGASAVVALTSPGELDPAARFGGIITRVVEIADRDEQRLRVTLESPLVAMKLWTDWRIFQRQTTRQIADACLEACGAGGAAAVWRLSEPYPPREVCAQLGESTFDFVSRLLEQDGIFYYTETTDEGTRVVFGDSAAACGSAGAVRYREHRGLIAGAAITSIADRAALRPSKVTLRDHDFERPSLDLDAVRESPAPFAREHYEYPGGYTDPALGGRRASARIAAFVAAAAGTSGESNVAALGAGKTFSLSGTPGSALDRRWLVVRATHEWDAESRAYRNRFDAIDADTPFRPLPATPPPPARGPMTAVVTGPPGEEIHCDSFGRVKVRFPWDRYAPADDRSSGWVRVGQLHTSGAVAIPRVGWEVLVELEDGDAARPIAVGRLYNAISRPPEELPANKAVSALQSFSTPGGDGRNAIRLEDSAGAERIDVHAQRDMVVRVAREKTERVASTADLQVARDHARRIDGERTTNVAGAHTLAVMGSQASRIGGALEERVGANDALEIGGTRLTGVAGSSTSATPGADRTSTKGALSEVVGGACVDVAAVGLNVAVAGAASVSVGAAKIEACAKDRSDSTVGARASVVGGASVAVAGKDVAVGTRGEKATVVGGAWMMGARRDVDLRAEKDLTITVGGAILANAESIVLRVGESSVTLSNGTILLDAPKITLQAEGPLAAMAPLVGVKP